MRTKQVREEKKNSKIVWFNYWETFIVYFVQLEILGQFFRYVHMNGILLQSI